MLANLSPRLRAFTSKKVGDPLNWKTVYASVQSIAKGSRDAAQALVVLRQEVIGTAELSAGEKVEMHEVLDGLQRANLYGQIALVGQLKEVLSKHPEFTKQYAEFGIRRST